MTYSYKMPFGLLNLHCDSEILQINRLIGPCIYEKFANGKYSMFLQDYGFYKDDTYRAKRISEGLYLGHHIDRLSCSHIKT